MADVKALATALVEKVLSVGGGFSLVEMESFLASKGLEVSGNLELAMERTNIVVWQGVSADFVKVYERALASNRVHWYPTSPLTYMVDGKWLRLPVVSKGMPEKGYKTPHWMPVVLNVGPDPVRHGGGGR